MARPTVDRYFMDMTQLVKSRGTCPRRQVGAVIVKDKHVLTTGYNGAPKGFPHPLDSGCIRDELQIPSGAMADVCPCLHAEQNAIIQAATFGVSVKGADIYCTTQPCTQCSRMIANSGIRRVIFQEEYADPLAIGLLTTAGVELLQWDEADASAAPYARINTWEQAQDDLRKRWAAGELHPKPQGERLPMADPSHATPTGQPATTQRTTTQPVPQASAPAAPSSPAPQEPASSAPQAGVDPAGEAPAHDGSGPRDLMELDARTPETVTAADVGIRDISSDPERAALIKKLAKERVEREKQRQSG